MRTYYATLAATPSTAPTAAERKDYADDYASGPDSGGTVPASSPYSLYLDYRPKRGTLTINLNAVPASLVEITVTPSAAGIVAVDYLSGRCVFHALDAGKTITATYEHWGSVLTASEVMRWEKVIAAHDTDITALEATDVSHDSRLDALEATDHAQNTDTGTSSPTFRLNLGGLDAAATGAGLQVEGTTAATKAQILHDPALASGWKAGKTTQAEVVTVSDTQTLTNKTLTTPTVNGSSLTAAGANVDDAVTKRHAQNTDTGTTADSFTVDSDGNAALPSVGLGSEYSLVADRAATRIKAWNTVGPGVTNFEASAFYGSGAGLTSVPDSALSSNISKLNAAETYTGLKVFNYGVYATTGYARFHDDNYGYYLGGAGGSTFSDVSGWLQLYGQSSILNLRSNREININSTNGEIELQSNGTCRLKTTIYGGAINGRLALNTTTTINTGPYCQGISYSSAISTKTAAYTATDTDSTILADATTAAFTVTLPTPATANSGQQWTIKKIDSTANAITVTCADGTSLIDGAATQSLAAQWASITVQSNGTAYYIISKVA